MCARNDLKSIANIKTTPHINQNNSPTNSIGNTEHFFATVTFGSGADTTALEVICFVFSNHHKLVWLRTCKRSAIPNHDKIIDCDQAISAKIEQG